MMYRTGLLLIFTLLLVFGSFQVFAQDDFSRYELDLTLDTETRVLSGTQTLDYFNDTGQTLEEVIFFLFPNFGREPNPYIDPSLLDAGYPEGIDPSWIEIGAVTDAGGNALDIAFDEVDPFIQTFSLENSLLRVKLPQPLAAGQRTTIVIEFETKFPHASNIDAVFYKNTYTWRFAWNPLAMSPQVLENHQLILPTAYYGATLQLPEDMTLASGAGRQTLTSHEDGVKTYRLDSDVPTRSLALAISHDFGMFSMDHPVAKIECYYLPGHEAAMRLAASYAATQLDYYAELYGDYGYDRLVIVDNPSPGTYGMAADGIILLGTDNIVLKDLLVPGIADRIFEWLIAHEVGHLWWGIGVGADFNAENWLSEGMAQYLSITYFEENHGGFGPNVLDHLGEGLIEDTIKDEFGFFNLRQHNVEAAYLSTLQSRFDEAIITSNSETEYGNALTFRTYMKGYLVLRALEGVIGRDAMTETLVTMNERYLHQVGTVEALQQVAEEVSGQDLDSFFQSWLYGDDTVDVAVQGFTSGETDTEAYQTDVTLTREGNVVYPVTVRVITEDEEEFEQTWLTETDETTIIFNTPTPVVAVHVDPNEMLPDKNRFNNHSPSKTVIKYGESDLPLDAYFIRVDSTGVRGQKGIEHVWSVNVIPRFELPIEDEVATEDSNADAAQESDEASDDPFDFDGRVLLDAVAIFSASLDRGLSVSGLVTMSNYDPMDEASNPEISGQVGVNLSLFEHPEVGTPSKFWWPANVVRAGAGVEGTLFEPLPFLALDFIRQDTLTLGWVNQLSLRAGLDGDALFARAGFSSSKRMRIMHSTYLDTIVTVGGAMDKLPEAMQFSLGELQGFADEFKGDVKAFGKISLSLPPMLDMNFSLANLAVLENVTLSGFAQGGYMWEAGAEMSFDMPKVEVGAQVDLDLSMTLGIPISFSIGYAYPVMGANEGELGLLYIDAGGLF